MTQVMHITRLHTPENADTRPFKQGRSNEKKKQKKIRRAQREKKSRKRQVGPKEKHRAGKE